MQNASPADSTVSRPLFPGLATRPVGTPPPPLELKFCRTCGRECPISAFYHEGGSTTRYRPDCKKCMRAQARRERSWEKPGEPQRCRCCSRLKPLQDFSPDKRTLTGRGNTCRCCHERRAEGLKLLPPTLEERQDELITQNTRLHEERIDLGLAIAHATCPPGHCRTLEELAAYAGVSEEAIRRIELRALAKMRRRAEEILAEPGLEDLVKITLP